jgi:hypothetical protein
VVKESGRVLPHPSAVFHAYASVDTPWVAQTLSHCTHMKQGKVSSNSVPHDATQFVVPHESRMRQYTTQSLFIQTQPTRTLIDIGRGYHLGALNFRSDHSPSFPSSILHFPLIAPPGLHLCQPFDHLVRSTYDLHRSKGPYHKRIPTTRLLPIAYTTKHSLLSLSFFHRGKQNGLVRVFLVRPRFHQTPILKCIIMA